MEKIFVTDSLDDGDGYQEGNLEEEAECWKNVLQTLSAVNSDSLTSQQKEALTLLFRLVRQGSTLTLTQNFRYLFLLSFSPNDFSMAIYVALTLTLSNFQEAF